MNTQTNILENRYPIDFPVPPDKISAEKLDIILKEELTEWKVVKSTLPENPLIEREELYREYVFRDFDQVLEYMGQVAIYCNMLPHHPRWENIWTTLKVYLTTWDNIHTISFIDIMLARHMERIFKDYGKTYYNVQSGMRISQEHRKFIKGTQKLKDSGDLEQAFNKLSQFIAQPGDLKNRDEIIRVIDNFNAFQKTARLNQLTETEMKAKTLEFEDKLDNIIKSFYIKPKVFFSYAWEGEKEKIVDDLHNSLKNEDHYELVRDKEDLNYGKVISEFMQTIGRGNIVIVAWSGKYLRSEYCMFELYELYRNSKLEKNVLLNKIIPIKVEPIDLNDIKVMDEYFVYWKRKEKELKKFVNQHNAERERYKIVQDINHSLNDLLSFLRNINSKTTEILSLDDFSEIKKAINQRVVEIIGDL